MRRATNLSIARRVFSQAASLARLTRLHNCAGAGLAAILGAYLAVPLSWNAWLPALQASLVVCLVVGASNVVNDLVDLSIDQLDKPYRPLPAGKISFRAAKWLAGGLLLSAVGISFSLGWIPFTISLAAGMISLAYSFFLKNSILIGNAVVGLLSGLTILFGSLVTGGVKSESLWAAGIVAWFVFTREVLKCIADRASDDLCGIQTVATRLGEQRTLRLFQEMSWLYAGIALVPGLLGLAPVAYLFAIILFSILPQLWTVARLQRENGIRSLSLALRLTKWTWFTGLIGLMFLR